jgi:hypothetical protein
MPKKMVLMGLFTDVMPTAEALDGLRLLGVREEDMNIMTGVPHSAKMLGRPKLAEFPWISVLGALTGLLIGLALTFGTQWLYPIRVGGRPFTAIPTSLVIIYECTMLGLLVSTFLSFLWRCAFPSTRPQYYDPSINNGRICLLCNFDMRLEPQIRQVMAQHGAERVFEPQRRPL